MLPAAKAGGIEFTFGWDACRRACEARCTPAEAARVLPDLSVVWVIALILTLAAILDRFVFRPVLKVVERREQAVSSARTSVTTSP